jgi:hypothetical protein
MLFHYFQIHPKELENLKTIFARVFNTPQKWSLLYGDDSKKSVRTRALKCKESDRYVFDTARKYLQQYFFDLNETQFEYSTSFLSSLSTLDSHPINTIGWHKDDDFTNLPCHTIVFYLDKTIQNGNLQVQLGKHTQIIPVQEGFALAFSGDVFHQVEKALGPGIRNVLVVHIPRK